MGQPCEWGCAGPVELGYDLAGNVTFAPFEINIADDCSSGHTVSSGLPYSHYGNPWMFTGQRYDAAVGLYAFKFRTYSPTLGRWLQRDPLGYVDGTNLYEYVQGAPLFWIDPFGLTIYFVYIEGSTWNPFGHAALKHVDENGKVTYYDLNDHGDGYKVNKYSDEEFKEKYKDRDEKEEVEVEVKNEDETVKHCEEQAGKKHDFCRDCNNCVGLVCAAIKKGGGHVYSDGSTGEEPNKYPRDARDGYKQHNQDKAEGTNKAVVEDEEPKPCNPWNPFGCGGDGNK